MYVSCNTEFCREVDLKMSGEKFGMLAEDVISAQEQHRLGNTCCGQKCEKKFINSLRLYESTTRW